LAKVTFEMYLGCALWRELRGSGVDLLIVLPGPTKTAFQKVAGTKVASWAVAFPFSSSDLFPAKSPVAHVAGIDRHCRVSRRTASLER
jgi:short-subunit dehydrogenase